MMNRHPVFMKEMRLLLRYLFLVLLAMAFSGLAPQFVMEILGQPLGPEQLHGVFYGGLMVLLLMYGLLAAATMSAEEKERGTDVFLASLSVSKPTIVAEKLVAAVICLVLAWTSVWVLIRLDPMGSLDQFGIQTTPLESATLLALVYLFGLAVARIVPNTMAIVLFGGTITFAAIMTWSLRDRLDAGDLLLSALTWVAVVLVSAILLSRRWQLGVHPALWRVSPALGLVCKSIAENASLHVAAWLLLLSALLIGSLLPETGNARGVLQVVITFSSWLTVVALGTSSFVGVERDPLGCVLYHHPISRQTIFLTKLLAPIPSLLAIILALLLVAPPNSMLPPAWIVLAVFFAWSLALLMSRAVSGFVVPLLSVYPVAGLIWMLIYDRSGVRGEFFVPGSSVVPGVVSEIVPDMVPDMVPGVGPAMTVALSSLVVVTVCCILGAWRMATDLRVVAGGTGYRQLTVGVIVLVSGVAVSMTGPVLRLVLG